MKTRPAAIERLEIRLDETRDITKEKVNSMLEKRNELP
jgi:hypothetical protein